MVGDHRLDDDVLPPLDDSVGGVVTAVLERSAPAPTPIIPRRRSRRRNVVPNLLGVFVFMIATFPVYWMVLTSFRRGIDIQRPTPQFLPSPGTLANYRKVFAP